MKWTVEPWNLEVVDFSNHVKRNKNANPQMRHITNMPAYPAEGPWGPGEALNAFGAGHSFSFKRFQMVLHIKIKV